MPTRITIPNILDTANRYIDGFDDLANDIANPPADRPLRGAIGRSGQVVCNFVGASPAAANIAFGAATPIVGLLCKPYWDKNNYSEPVPTGGVIGGQCNVSYTFPGDVRSATGAFATVSNTVKVGPITGINKILNGGGSGIDRYVISGPNVISPNIDISRTATGATRLRGPFRAGQTTPDFACGDGSGSGLAPGQNPPPTPPTFPTGSEPGTDSEGQPFFFVPPIDFPTDFNDPKDIPDGEPYLGPIEPPPPGPGSPGTPVTPSPGSPAEGEAEEGDELVGVLVELLSVPPNANKFQDISVNVYRGIGYVRMGYPDRLGVDTSAAVAQTVQFYHAQQRGLTAWEVVPRNGFTIRVTPYYRTP